MPDPRSLASFGFRDVPVGEKEGLVRGVFSSVAKNYDLMNDLMSGGIHRLWKDAMVDWLNPRPGWRVLDVAGGTGDIAFRIAKAVRASRRGRHPEVRAQRASKDGRAPQHDESGNADIVVCDINPEMLTEGVKRAKARGEGTIAWIAGNAEALPLPDAGFDAYTIAFGIRNVTHIDRALAEAERVLKPGGRFLCLEFSQVQVPGLDVLYDKFSFSVLPRLGEIVAGEGEAYRYLVESIRRFPPQAKFARMIEAAGLAQVRVRNLSGGIAALHSAWKI